MEGVFGNCLETVIIPSSTESVTFNSNVLALCDSVHVFHFLKERKVIIGQI